MTREEIARIIRSLCYVHIQGREGMTLPTESIAFIEVRGVELAAEQIAERMREPA